MNYEYKIPTCNKKSKIGNTGETVFRVIAALLRSGQVPPLPRQRGFIRQVVKDQKCYKLNIEIGTLYTAKTGNRNYTEAPLSGGGLRRSVGYFQCIFDRGHQLGGGNGSEQRTELAVSYHVSALPGRFSLY